MSDRVVASAPLPGVARALGFVLRPWRASAGRLGAGFVVAALSALAGVALLALAGGTAGVGHTGVAGGRLAGTLLLGGAVLRVLGVGRIALRYGERLVTHDATFRALAALRVTFFESLARVSAAGLGYRRAGDLLSRLVADVDALDALYLRVAVPFVAALVTLPLLVWAPGRRDPVLGLLVGGAFVLAAFVVPLAIAIKVGVTGERTARESAALRVAVLDLVTGLREIRAFGAEGRMLARAQTREAALNQAQRDDARRVARADLAGFGLGQAALFAVLLAIATGALGTGRDGRAVALVAVFAVFASFDAAGALPRAGVLAASAVAAARRVAAVAAAPGPRPSSPSRADAVPNGHALRFEAVEFAWRPGRPVLDGLTMIVPAGARVAVLGVSGAGKSTLAQLALGLAAPLAGTVTLGGVPVAAIEAARLRQTIALLNQSTHLFADTVRANLLLARPDADDALLWRALEAASLGDTVRTLPGQLDTWLGEGGNTLSGGEARRLALARTLLSPAPVLILDEPASGLDGDNERALLRTLAGDAGGLLAGRTVILIAHRLTGVERLDRIWRLSGGRAAAATA